MEKENKTLDLCEKRLNPCWDGRCSMSGCGERREGEGTHHVSILVVVEDAQ